jgi:hypothetical protein
MTNQLRPPCGDASYKTTELELASFLKARGHRLLGASPRGTIVEFSFDGSASGDVGEYIAGAAVRARELFEAHRALRALIATVREHNQNRSERNDYAQHGRNSR